MKISFVIPAYNEEKLLPKCIESIQRELQRGTYDAEIIVVNNASTDRTGEIARSYPGVIVVDEPAKGLTRARQAGYVAASGELIANVDADTMLPEGWVATVLREFGREKNLVALSGPYIHYDFSRTMRVLVKLFYLSGLVAHYVNQYVFRTGAMIQGGNFVLRRAALQKIGGFDTSIAFYGEDTDIAKRMATLGNVKWTFRLPMYTTARRLKHEGVVATTWRYVINFFWITFTGKPQTNAYTDVRQ